MSGYAQAEQGHYVTATAAPEREGLVREFNYATEDLFKAIHELGERLSPVLAPDYPDRAAASDPALPVSEARNELHRLHAATSELRDIMSRLEV